MLDPPLPGGILIRSGVVSPMSMRAEIRVQDFRDTLLDVARTGGCDLILTSPPYDDARTYGSDVSFTFTDYQNLGTGIMDALRPGGHALVNLSGPVRETPRGTERSLTSWRVLLDWVDRVGLRCPDVLAYGRRGVPGAYVGRYRQDWEPVLWLCKPGATPYFDKQALAVDSATQGNRIGQSASVRKATGELCARPRSGWAVENGKVQRGTLWWYASVGHGHGDGELERSGHPARFDIRFAYDAVLAHSPPGGLVCDPFVGSGTSALAAITRGRSFVGGDSGTNPAGIPWANVAMRVVAPYLEFNDLFG